MILWFYDSLSLGTAHTCITCCSLCGLQYMSWFLACLGFGFFCVELVILSYLLLFFRNISHSTLHYMSIALPIVQWGFCQHLHTHFHTHFHTLYASTSGCKLLQRYVMWIVFFCHFQSVLDFDYFVYCYSRTGVFQLSHKVFIHSLLFSCRVLGCL